MLLFIQEEAIQHNYLIREYLTIIVFSVVFSGITLKLENVGPIFFKLQSMSILADATYNVVF